VVHGRDEPVLELLLRRDADMTEHRTGELGEEALDQVEPGAMFGCEGELKSAAGLLGQPSSGFPRDMRGMIVEDQMDCRVGRVGRIDSRLRWRSFARA
jgi:hypothetical protein